MGCVCVDTHQEGEHKSGIENSKEKNHFPVSFFFYSKLGSVKLIAFQRPQKLAPGTYMKKGYHA